jgi:hypothetical protein
VKEPLGKYEHAEMMPNVVGSREGWELYIVTDGVMVGILLGEGAQWSFHDIGHHLSMFISDCLIMTF